MSGLEIALGGIEAAVGVSQLYSAVSSAYASPSKSELLSAIKEKGEKRSILLASGEIENVDVEKELEIMVESPILTCLRRLVLREAPAPYVLYAPPSSGKTTAARAFMKFSLKRLFPTSQEIPHAIMLSGSVDESTYFEHIPSALQAGKTPWFASLMMALSRSPGEISSGKPPSIIILDNFDDCGPDNVNVKNMKHFCHDLHRLQEIHGKSLKMFVIILTQNRDTGNALCKINNWKKIAPMPGSYTELPPDEREAETLPDPGWTKMPWSEEEMRALVAKLFSEDELKGISLDFIVAGAIPTRVIRHIEAMVWRKVTASNNKDPNRPDFP